MHAPCEAGLEEVLASELGILGARGVRVGRRGVSFVGEREIMWRANLQCRTANRVLVQIANFDVGPNGRDALYDAVSRMPFPDWMHSDATLAVDTIMSQRQDLAVNLVNQVVKDAICDRFRREAGRRPSVDRQDPDVPISVYLSGRRCTLSLDSSGARLHRRGYRDGSGPAPLKETIAAGLLALAGYRGHGPLVDPMCGSGTIAIEAALISRNIASGLLRLDREGEGFGFQRWKTHDEDEFDDVVRRLEDEIEPRTRGPVVGSDVDGRVLTLARSNARRAGVFKDIRFERLDVADAAPPGPNGLLVTNPPYGERLGDLGELPVLYKALGDVMKQRFGGYDGYVLTSEKALMGAVGLKAKRKIPIFNGPIDCRLLRYELWDGTRRTAAPAPPPKPPEDPENPVFPDPDA